MIQTVSNKSSPSSRAVASLSLQSTEKTSLKRCYDRVSISQKDQKQLGQIWSNHQDFLFQQSLKWMGGNYHDAEEALSRSFLKFWSAIRSQFSRITNLKAWLARIVRNTCMDLHREKKKSFDLLKV